MFKEQSKITTEAIPERVFSLYKIVEQRKSIKKSDLQEMLVPKEVNQGNDSGYFSNCLEVAKELDLVIEENNKIFLNEKITSIKDMVAFRKYINSILITNYSNGSFNIVTESIFNAGRKILKYGSVSSMREFVDIKIDNQTMNGWRFWASFLGFGILTMNGVNNTGFLPNCYQFIKDILPLTVLNKKPHSFSEFINAIYPYARIVLAGIEQKRINYGMSNALRTLHDDGVIKMEFINDQKDVWLLDKIEMHQIKERVTNITIL